MMRPSDSIRNRPVEVDATTCVNTSTGHGAFCELAVITRADADAPVQLPIREAGAVAREARHLYLQVVQLVRDLCPAPCELVVKADRQLRPNLS